MGTPESSGRPAARRRTSVGHALVTAESSLPLELPRRSAGAAEPPRTRRAPPERLRAFGLDVRLGPGNGLPSSRGVRWELAPSEAVERAWRAHERATLVDFRFDDGRTMLNVEHAPGVGYRIWAPRFGRHVVAADGRAITSSLPRLAAWRWQRLFSAQVLPLAAALQGLELFHASAVAVGARAVGFVAASGTGKTSVAAHLVAAGADFVTDDVLALEVAGDGVLAHPGAPLASVDAAELAAMPPARRVRVGEPIGRDDKVHLAARPVDGPLGLAALYYLRRGTGAKVTIRPAADTTTRRLLASSFLVYLRSPERLLTHLDVCARVAAAVPAFDVVVPPSSSARETAGAVAAHAGLPGTA